MLFERKLKLDSTWQHFVIGHSSFLGRRMLVRVIERFVTIDIHPDPGDHPPFLLPPPPPQSPASSATWHVSKRLTASEFHGVSSREKLNSISLSSGCAVAATCRLEPLLLPAKWEQSHPAPGQEVPHSLASTAGTETPRPGFSLHYYFSFAELLHVQIFPQRNFSLSICGFLV